MKNESGRSLIEILGVLAITGVITAGAIKMYGTIRKNQTRSMAVEEIKTVVKNIKILMENRQDYTGVSIDYLIKAGALNSDKSPIINTKWDILSSTDGDYFIISFIDLSEADCVYFSKNRFDWATDTLVNGYRINEVNNCFKSDTNQISFIAK